jgi:hypothetical protein
MTQTAVATEIHQALDIHGYFAPQITLDAILGHFGADCLKGGFGQILNRSARINSNSCANVLRATLADAIYSRQTDYGMLVWWYVNPDNTCHLLRPSSILIKLKKAKKYNVEDDFIQDSKNPVYP